jgi:hypothetical protein
LLSLYQVMDRPGPITRDREPLAAGYPWGVNEPLKSDELQAALKRLAELKGMTAPAPAAPSGGTITEADLAKALASMHADWRGAMENITFADSGRVTAGEFALVAAKLLVP